MNNNNLPIAPERANKTPNGVKTSNWRALLLAAATLSAVSGLLAKNTAPDTTQAPVTSENGGVTVSPTEGGTGQFLKLDISELTFPDGVGALVIKAAEAGLSGTINNKIEFEVMKGQIVQIEQEQKRLAELQKKQAFEEALKVDVKTLEFPRDVEKMNGLLEALGINYKVNPGRGATFSIALEELEDYQIRYKTEQSKIRTAEMEKNIAGNEAKIKKSEQEIDANVAKFIKLAKGVNGGNF